MTTPLRLPTISRLTPDARDALLYYEGRCEGLCGEGVYAWLRRDAPEKKWSIKRRIT